MKVLYRLSDNGYQKTKFDFASKQACLENCLANVVGTTDEIHLFVDDTNISSDTHAYIEHQRARVHHMELYTGGSSAGSFRHVLKYALDTFADEDIVYFLEDDYLHLPDASVYIQEALARSNYVSLYDHKDKYIPSRLGGNPYISEWAGEETVVILTESSHWKITNSTTMTFAATVRQLKTDARLWDHYITGTHPNDFQAFLSLREAGRSLITPIPGRATHCEPQWAAPLIDWSTV